MQKINIKKKRIILKIFLILFIFSSSVTAQIEFGIKGGLNFNSGLNETYLIEALQSQGKPDGDFNIFDKKNWSFFWTIFKNQIWWVFFTTRTPLYKD